MDIKNKSKKELGQWKENLLKRKAQGKLSEDGLKTLNYLIEHEQAKIKGYQSTEHKELCIDKMEQVIKALPLKRKVRFSLFVKETKTAMDDAIAELNRKNKGPKRNWFVNIPLYNLLVDEYQEQLEPVMIDGRWFVTRQY